jgi:ABC-type Zn uptake system ZnuABC Zn-binding protein ZnuA
MTILTPNQPTANDARNFATADIVFANGVGLETWLDPLVSNVRPGTPVVRLGGDSGIALLPGSGDEQSQGDPHAWQDPTNVQKMVSVIRDTLIGADPDNGPSYQANATAYIDQLGQLDQWIGPQIQSIPLDQRKLVTNHDAFMYYLNRYGLIAVGLGLISASGS